MSIKRESSLRARHCKKTGRSTTEKSVNCAGALIKKVGAVYAASKWRICVAQYRVYCTFVLRGDPTGRTRTRSGLVWNLIRFNFTPRLFFFHSDSRPRSLASHRLRLSRFLAEFIPYTVFFFIQGDSSSTHAAVCLYKHGEFAKIFLDRFPQVFGLKR